MALRLSTLLVIAFYSSYLSAKEPAPKSAVATPAPKPATAAQPALPLEDLRLFAKAFENIRTGYVTEISDAKLLEYALKGMLSELDPHSAYLDSSSLEELQTHTTGEFGGLGIEVGGDPNGVKVISPMDDTPAAKAGILAGDIIIKIDGTLLKGLPLDEAIEKMRGAKGSKTELTIMRTGQNKPLVFNLVRDVIKVKSVRGEMIGENYAYLRVAQFQVNTGEELVNTYQALANKVKPQGVILDLRNNPGGVLQASVAVADMFMDGGLVVYTQGRLPQSNEKFYAQPKDLTEGIPLVVLINEGSASASEIVAGALQDSKRGLVLGTRSFGKGSVQTVVPLTDEKAMKLTTALYFTPNGRSIQAQGIVPDIRVERAKFTGAEEDQLSVSEAELNGHLANGTGGQEIKAQERQIERDKAANKLQAKDNQLFEALNLLKAITVLQKK
ncbi:MAG TPA: S41 family peptidase [Cellvibrionaceae bacterium]